jgi:hypothetical protein
MGWHTTGERDTFLAHAGEYLRERAAENFTLLSAAGGVPADGALYGWWAPHDGAGPRAAFLHGPARRLILAGQAPEPAAALAVTLYRAGQAAGTVAAVDAPSASADAFAAAWSQRSGMAVRLNRSTRVYRLTSPVTGYQGPSGRPRQAGPADRDLLVAWLGAMAAETGSQRRAPGEAADDFLRYGGVMLWEAGGEPAAMAAVTRPVAGVARVTSVYTVPAHRGRGYAVAVTAAACRASLARASEIVVLADGLRPPRRTSRLGFEQIAERSLLSFGPPTGPLPVQRRTGPLPRIR